jgi:hypothetical protein
MKLRPDAQRAEVYNEGLAVYLHDPANVPAILAANPTSILSFCDVEPSKDKALKKVVEQGLLVTYFLRQDDAIVVDVSVGPPLDKAEIKALAKQGVPLMKPSQTVISLPGGRLRIDTANTFRLSEDARACAEEYEKEHGKPPADNNLKAFGLEDKSGEVQVPPGDYVLTLYRVDFEKMEDSDDEDDEGFDGPGEFITLTPADEIERPKRIPAVIEYGAGYARVSGLRAWKLENGKFLGRMVGGYACNFSWRHAQKLGLRRGQHLRLRHDNKDYDAVYLAGVEPRADQELCALLYPDLLDGLHKTHPEWLSAAIYEGSIVKVPLMWIQPLNKNIMLTAEKMSSLEIEPLDDFVLPAPPEGPVPQGACENGVLRGTVLAAGAGGLELGCGAKALKALRAGKAAELRLSIGGKFVHLLLLPDIDHRHRPYHIAGSVEREDDVLFKDVFAYMIEGGDDVFRACVGRSRSNELVALLKEYKKGCTFTSTDGYVPKDPEAAKGRKARCVALWREGVGRYAEPGALSAVLVRHWDDPNATSLSCRVIAYQGVNRFADSAGQEFEVVRAE